MWLIHWTVGRTRRPSLFEKPMGVGHCSLEVAASSVFPPIAFTSLQCPRLSPGPVPR
jgi:hypothetical protein